MDELSPCNLSNSKEKNFGENGWLTTFFAFQVWKEATKGPLISVLLSDGGPLVLYYDFTSASTYKWTCCLLDYIYSYKFVFDMRFLRAMDSKLIRDQSTCLSDPSLYHLDVRPTTFSIVPSLYFHVF